MARRSDHSREELRALFLASARKFAEAEGLAGIGARAIARDVGYTPGTIYNVFGSLDGLVMALRAEALDELYARAAHIPLDAGPAENLRRLAAAYTAYVIEHPRLWNVIFDGLPEGDALPDWYRQKIARLIGLIEVAIAPLFAHGDEAARRHEAWVLWSSYHGIASVTVAGRIGGGGSLSSLAESLIENYVYALAHRRTATKD